MKHKLILLEESNHSSERGKSTDKNFPATGKITTNQKNTW